MSAPAEETLQRLKDQDWEILLNRIEDKKCTPILGTETRSEVLNLRTEIAKEWAEKYLGWRGSLILPESPGLFP